MLILIFLHFRKIYFQRLKDILQFLKRQYTIDISHQIRLSDFCFFCQARTHKYRFAAPVKLLGDSATGDHRRDSRGKMPRNLLKFLADHGDPDGTAAAG